MTAERNWWASAWITTFEERSRLDPNRMPRGLEYAASGQVGDLTLMPGEARARAQGRMAVPYDILEVFAERRNVHDGRLRQRPRAQILGGREIPIFLG